MPATYAHYRFGTQMLRQMPGDLHRTVKRYRRLFDVGLHGPDLFFFYRPIFPTKIGRLGHKFHMQTGREFFGRVCRNLRLEPSEAGQAYLYGALCHYVLDAHCHPLVVQADWEGPVTHSRIEAEFDRFLMEKDGICPPREMRLTKHMTLTDTECGIVSRFYPGTDKKVIRESLRGMANVRKILEIPEGPVRDALIKTMSLGSDVFRDMIVWSYPDPVCSHLDLPLMEQYRQAAQEFPRMLLKLSAHLTYNAPLGEEFSRNFG